MTRNAGPNTRGTLRPAAAGLLVCCLLAPAALADLTYTEPDPNATGGITGVVKPAKGLRAVLAIESFEMKVYKGKADASTGRFSFSHLPPGEYDLLIKCVGRLYEGISLEPDAGQPPTPDELKQIAREVAPAFFESEAYFNEKRIVRLTGSGERARLFAIQTRTKKVVDPGARPINGHIRRLDFVDLVKTRDTWQIKVSRHLLRQEVPYESDDITLTSFYSPRLGRLLIGEKLKDLGEIELDKLPPGPEGRYQSAEYHEP